MIRLSSLTNFQFKNTITFLKNASSLSSLFVIVRQNCGFNSFDRKNIPRIAFFLTNLPFHFCYLPNKYESIVGE